MSVEGGAEKAVGCAADVDVENKGEAVMDAPETRKLSRIAERQ